MPGGESSLVTDLVMIPTNGSNNFDLQVTFSDILAGSKVKLNALDPFDLLEDNKSTTEELLILSITASFCL